MPRGRPRKNKEAITNLDGQDISQFPESPEQIKLIEDYKLPVNNIKVADIQLPDESIKAKINLDQKTVQLVEKEDETKTVTLDPAAEIYHNIPPIIRKRNEYGLLENVNYIFKEDGRVNWKSMIKDEFLVFNREKKDVIEKKYNKKLEDLNISDLEDSDKDKFLLILLGGIRDLANLRGFNSFDTNITHSTDFKAVAVTHINWVPNYESEGDYIETTGVGSASLQSASGFGQLFLESIAENRSFVRAVRNYLEINIVGSDEIKVDYSNNKKEESPQTERFDIKALLQKSAEQLGLTFDKFKEGCEKYKSDLEGDYTKWTDYSSISGSDSYRILNILQKAIEANKKK